jgi:hypothetical protein
MIDYTPSYLNLQRRIAILPDPDPRDLLQKIKKIPANYPPELLKTRREHFVSQIRRINVTSSNRPAANGRVG